MAKTVVKGRVFDEERALYEVNDIDILSCRFDGPRDGENALMESKYVTVSDSYFNLRSPMWHVNVLKLENSELTRHCTSALWYTGNAFIRKTKMNGAKALRECSDITIVDSEIDSDEFGWSSSDINMRCTHVQGKYFMMRSEKLFFENVSLNGKDSFQYVNDSEFNFCSFNTKNAFWHCKDVVVRNSVIKGEYLGWYCENVTFENCTIISTQPFCHSKNIKLINCKMEAYSDYAYPMAV